MINLTSIKTIKELLTRHGFNFSKSLGQNFLINPSVCPKIVAAAVEQISETSETCESSESCENPEIYGFEIGAGVGVLTKELAKVCKKVVVVEIDKNLKPILDETLCEFSNIEIIWGDVLKLDLKQIFAEHFGENSDIICCANLPYYITSPVIMRLLEERLPLKSVTVMVQKEAAERLCAAPGTRACGAVSAAVRYYSLPRKLFDVSRNSFMPAPNVDSAVIKLDIHGKTRGIKAEDEKLFFKIIRAAFSQRRKQLTNPVSESLNLPKETIRAALAACKIKETARAEELTLEGFWGLYKIIGNLSPKL